MITCDSCKFWKLSDNDRCPKGMGDCLNEKFIGAYYTPGDDIPPIDDLFITESDEGWGFFTGPKFGCIHGISEVER